MIRQSFISCALTCTTDGSQDDDITCFKPGEPCQDGRVMLKEQFDFINTEEESPFQVEDGDIVDAYPDLLLVDADEEGDEDFIVSKKNISCKT